MSLRDSLDSDQIVMLQDACRPDCRLKQTISSPKTKLLSMFNSPRGANMLSSQR